MHIIELSGGKVPYCGFFIWGSCFLVFAVVVSIIPGFAAYLLARKKKSPTKELFAALSVVGTFFLMIFICISYYRWFASDFYCNRGFADSFRIPLEYPYQISAVDILDDGCLDIWPDRGSCIIQGITHYTVKDSIIVGRIGPSESCFDCPERWFSFNFDTHERHYYYSEQEFVTACKELGFVRQPVLKSVSEHYHED